MILWSLGGSQPPYIILLEGLFSEVATNNFNYFNEKLSRSISPRSGLHKPAILQAPMN
jgi:hypothetical protein